MIKKLHRIILQPHLLVLIWFVFLLSPILSVFRLYYLVNTNFLGFRIMGFSSLLLYFPFLMSSIVFLILIFWFKEFIDKKLSVIHRRTLMILSFLSLIFLVVARLIINLEQRNYPNFLYGHYGITVSQLEFMSFVGALELLLFLSILAYDLTFRTKEGTVINTSRAEKASLFLAVIGFLGLVILSASTFMNWSLLVDEEKGGYESRVGAHYKYIILLIDHTPKNAKIIHPPQGDRWPAIGNQPVLRYFLFPRVLITGALLNNKDFAERMGDAYFVEMDPDSDFTHWPKIDAGKKTIIFDETTEVSYKRLEVMFESGAGKIFKVSF